MTLDVGGRWLVVHRSELEEWGVSGGVVVEPDAGGRGLSLSVRPAWGEAEGGASRLWEEGRDGTAEKDSGAVLEAELGYGLGAFGGFGVATPYTRYGQARDERRYGMGWRLAPVGGRGVRAGRGRLAAQARDGASRARCEPRAAPELVGAAVVVARCTSRSETISRIHNGSLSAVCRRMV